MGNDNKNPFVITTLAIAITLIVAGLAFAITIIVIRFKNMAVVSEDALLATIAVVLVAAGIALTAFANGVHAKLAMKSASATEQPSIDGLQNLKDKFLNAIQDRIGSITITGAATLSSANKLITLNPVFRDSSNHEFRPEKDMLGLKWKSDHPEFARVDDNGVVTFMAAGTTKITVTFRNFTSAPVEITCT